MKKKFMIGMMMVVAMALVAPASAHRYTRGNDHPFRIIGYVGNAVGIGLEYAIMRPIHWVVSQPNLDIVFGHDVSQFEDGTYFEWTHGDFSPSIAEEHAKKEKKATSKPAAKENKAAKAETKKSAKVAAK